MTLKSPHPHQQTACSVDSGLLQNGGVDLPVFKFRLKVCLDKKCADAISNCAGKRARGASYRGSCNHRRLGLLWLALSPQRWRRLGDGDGLALHLLRFALALGFVDQGEEDCKWCVSDLLLAVEQRYSGRDTCLDCQASMAMPKDGDTNARSVSKASTVRWAHIYKSSVHQYSVRPAHRSLPDLPIDVRRPNTAYSRSALSALRPRSMCTDQRITPFGMTKVPRRPQPRGYFCPNAGLSFV